MPLNVLKTDYTKLRRLSQYKIDPLNQCSSWTKKTNTLGFRHQSLLESLRIGSPTVWGFRWTQMGIPYDLKPESLQSYLMSPRTSWWFCGEPSRWPCDAKTEGFRASHSYLQRGPMELNGEQLTRRAALITYHRYHIVDGGTLSNKVRPSQNGSDTIITG